MDGRRPSLESISQGDIFFIQLENYKFVLVIKLQKKNIDSTNVHIISKSFGSMVRLDFLGKAKGFS